MTVSAARVRAFRLARHHLARRLPGDRVADAAVVGLQDTPPGAAALALCARADTDLEALEQLVIVPSVLVAHTPEPLVPPPNTSPNWYRRR